MDSCYKYIKENFETVIFRNQLFSKKKKKKSTELFV